MNKTALIIEDDEDLADIFAEALRSIGYTVENAIDGKIAQDRLNVGEPPFLILLDMHLPHISGKQLLKEMKSTDRFNQTWIFITTADARLAEEHRDQVDIALIKPILYGQLRDLAIRLKPKDQVHL